MDDQRYVVYGEVAILDEQSIEITELPIRTWTQAYKENVLEPMLQGTDKVPATITYVGSVSAVKFMILCLHFVLSYKIPAPQVPFFKTLTGLVLIVNCLAILAKAPIFFFKYNCFNQFFLMLCTRKQQTFMYCACF